MTSIILIKLRHGLVSLLITTYFDLNGLFYWLTCPIGLTQGFLNWGACPPWGGMKASPGGREHDSDILMKSSFKLQSNLVTTSLLIHYIRICDLVLKNNFVWTLIRYCFNFRCLIYIDTSLYASPSFLRGRCHLARRFCTFSFIRSFLSHAVKPYFPNFLKVHERDSLLTLL